MEGSSMFLRRIILEIPDDYVSRPYSPTHSYSKDNIEELLYDIETGRDKMFDEFYRNIDDIYFPLVNPVAALEGQMEMEALKMKIDSPHETIRRQQDHITKDQEAIKSFVGIWFEMSKDDVDTCFPTSRHLPPY
ncbi:hypothetical protein DY000_02016122 [Brassica cretica]|uniref:Uncharacterized protein n=1 Tax=Brassica cretica TaxID=69181 RepID=A0ABQ7D3T9_BRACR|nr:hypothetical protein DY000_02016122 [Brassica cretica]